MKINLKAVSPIAASVVIGLLALNTSADGASTSVASQISILQKKVIELQTQVSNLKLNANITNLPSAYINYFTLTGGCKPPAIIVAPIDKSIPLSSLCRMKVYYDDGSVGPAQ